MNQIELLIHCLFQMLLRVKKGLRFVFRVLYFSQITIDFRLQPFIHFDIVKNK